MKTTFFYLLLGAFVFASCTNNEPKPIVDAQPIPLSAKQKQRVVQDNDFAFDLMKQTLANTQESNVFLSPLSVSIALGMVRNGAIGETKTEIETALEMNNISYKEINAYYHLMQTTLPTMDPKTKLSIANSIWIRDGFSVKQEFLKTNSNYFNTYVKSFDFNQPWALDTINGWAERKTNGLIPKVLSKIDNATASLLMNAIYFKGTWVKQFDEEYTREMDFTNEFSKNTTVNMMSLKASFPYMEDKSAQYLDMPYGNKDFYMTVILPKYGNSTTDVLQKITPVTFSATLEAMDSTEVNVFLPRFKVKNTFQLKPMLQAMGMNLPFEREADFGNMSDEKPLYISFVQHDTYVEVTEEGTEAAAVTTIGMTTGASQEGPKEVYFIADRPFLFIIREKSTGVILFIGKMGNVEKH